VPFSLKQIYFTVASFICYLLPVISATHHYCVVFPGFVTGPVGASKCV
jgi:hypothetical protein